MAGWTRSARRSARKTLRSSALGLESPRC
jgi:hypothetical protein